MIKEKFLWSALMFLLNFASCKENKATHKILIRKMSLLNLVKLMRTLKKIFSVFFLCVKSLIQLKFLLIISRCWWWFRSQWCVSIVDWNVLSVDEGDDKNFFVSLNYYFPVIRLKILKPMCGHRIVAKSILFFV